MAQVRSRGGIVTTSVGPTDRDLVLAFQAGEDRAYDRIYGRYRPAVEATCRRLLRNPHDAEEATQEAMLRVLQALPTFNGRYMLGAWVSRIATNVCLDILRARSRRPNGDHPLDAEVVVDESRDADPGELAALASDRRTVHAFLETLPDHYRAALVLREIEGRSHAEIASALDTSPARVKALIHRAKRTFRRQWAATDDRRGLRALVPPILLGIRMPGVLRRALQTSEAKVVHATEAAVPVFVSPVMATAAVTSERFTAAVTALFVGTVGIGAAVTNRPSPPEERPPAVIAAAPEASRPEPSPETKPVARERKAPKKQKTQAEKPAAVAEPAPSPAPSPSVAPSPTTEVSPPPPPSPEPQATPATPPHPAGFTFAFSSDRQAEEGCDCGSEPSLTEDTVAVAESGVRSFAHQVTGAAILDADGTPAWSTDLQGTWKGYEHTLGFTIQTADGTSTYDASGRFLSRAKEEWGGWTLTFSGDYYRRGGPIEHVDVPHNGRYEMTLTFSVKEKRLVALDLDLTEG